MDTRISKLIRTNAALLLLCIISIGVLVMVFRDGNNDKADKLTELNTPTVEVRVKYAESDDMRSSTIDDVPESSPLKHAPDPSLFSKFTFFDKQATTSISFECNNVYGVALIYPTTIDYRVNPLAFVYNRAFACENIASSTTVIDLRNTVFHASTTYYIVRAHQGRQGGWYGPY